MKYAKQLITVLVLFFITLSGVSADQYSNKAIHWGIKDQRMESLQKQEKRGMIYLLSMGHFIKQIQRKRKFT